MVIARGFYPDEECESLIRLDKVIDNDELRVTETILSDYGGVLTCGWGSESQYGIRLDAGSLQLDDDNEPDEWSARLNKVGD